MWLQIKPEEPLILGEVRADSQFLTSRHYIPARVLRGAWAEYLAVNGMNEEEILRTVSQVRIGNFFPASSKPLPQYALPLPLSAVSCKLTKGFRSQTPPGDRHGVLDSLVPRLAYHLLEQQGARLSVPFSLICRECQGPMEPFSGFYAFYSRDGSDRFASFAPQFHAQTKVALSRHRRASAEGMLYTASALSPRMQEGGSDLIFLGRVFSPNNDVPDSFWKALESVALGALHTRGYGRVTVAEATVALPTLEKRLESFNQMLKALWCDLRQLAPNAQRLPSELEGVYFSVDLLAPGVFQDEGVPTLVPSLTLCGQTLNPIFWLTRPDMASGWSTGWGLPKPTRLAARMGSVYAFRWDGSPEALLPALQHLEEHGVGACRDEGFGECLVCHPFHQEVEER